MKREAERKELERKKCQQVEFVSGGAQVANLAAASKISLAVSGSLSIPIVLPESTSQLEVSLLRFSSSIFTIFAVANVAAAGALQSALTAPDPINREGRQNKKSKWDKVLILT